MLGAISVSCTDRDHSEPDEHSEPLFKNLEILKFTDLVTLHNALLMYHYYHNLPPSSFEFFFFKQ